MPLLKMYIHSPMKFGYPYRQKVYRDRLEWVRHKVVHWFRRRFRITTSLWPIVHYLNKKPLRLYRFLWHIMPEEQDVSLSFLFDDIFHNFHLPSFLEAAQDPSESVVHRLCDDVLSILEDDALYDAAKAIPCLTWIGSFIIPIVGQEIWMARVKEMRIKETQKNIEQFMDGTIHYLLPFDTYDEFHLLISDVSLFQERVRHAIHKARFKEGLIHYIRDSNMAMDWRWYLIIKQKKKKVQSRRLIELEYAYEKTKYIDWISSMYQGDPLSYHAFVKLLENGEITWKDPAQTSETVLLW